ncbi:hypothetical protein BDZ91DRAFT_758190 [Kalaharituber pfeilii]|nr:hypothetical protein BDZ91DRAFT_758190 [Kalaharituber pfeilii]
MEPPSRPRALAEIEDLAVGAVNAEPGMITGHTQAAAACCQFSAPGSGSEFLAIPCMFGCCGAEHRTKAFAEGKASKAEGKSGTRGQAHTADKRAIPREKGMSYHGSQSGPCSRFALHCKRRQLERLHNAAMPVHPSPAELAPGRGHEHSAAQAKMQSHCTSRRVCMSTTHHIKHITQRAQTLGSSLSPMALCCCTAPTSAQQSDSGVRGRR